jgi:hypothetical protein
MRSFEALGVAVFLMAAAPSDPAQPATETAMQSSDHARPAGQAPCTEEAAWVDAEIGYDTVLLTMAEQALRECQAREGFLPQPRQVVRR